MLASKFRFHGHGSLKYVYKNADAVRSRLISLKLVPNQHRKNSRFSVVVSKKVYKGAVGRNRMRRRFYEIVRAEMPNLNGTYDMVLLVFSSEVMNLPQEELVATVRDLFTRAGVYKSLKG